MSTPYWNPVRVLIEKGAFEKLPDLMAPFAPERILVVLGGRSFRGSPYFQKLNQMLEPYAVIFSAPVPANPSAFFLEEEIRRLAQESYDLVLAIGGGSVLDSGKLFAVIPFQACHELVTYTAGAFQFARPGRPLIAVPTTSGTGSEVTSFSSLETADKKKVSIAHPALYPAAALVDSRLCHSMPAYVTGSTGFDALSQAIESFWSVHATPASRTHSLAGLEMILAGFERVMKEPQDEEARFQMAYGSCEAGLGISHARTTAVHAVSYPITSHFGVAHGHACALTLAEFVKFNAPVLKEEGRPLLKRFAAEDYAVMAQKIERLMPLAGLERSLSQLGMDASAHEVILRDGFRPDRVKNNPRPLIQEDLRRILENIA